MSLFGEKRSHDVDFNKEEVIKNILERFHKELPDWSLLQAPCLKCDLTCIKNVEIKEEINITKNPFSHYKKVIDSIYHIVINVHVLSNKNDDEEIVFDPFGTHVMISSSDQLFRKLKSI